jgi:protein MAK16
MNVIGYCKMEYCPLANSQYATVIEKDGVIYLCMKTAERAHLPREHWEKVPLNFNKEQAYAQIERSMRFWDWKQINRCKARFVKIMLMLRRMRKIRKEGQRSQMVVIKKKEERKLAARESKAMKAAMLEHKIEDELLERLRKGVYGKLYKTEEERMKEKQTEKDLAEDKIEEDIQFEEDEEEEEEFDYDENDLAEFDYSDAEEDIEDIYAELEEELEDMEDQQTTTSKTTASKKRGRDGADDSSTTSKRARRRKHLEIEYDEDHGIHRNVA